MDLRKVQKTGDMHYIYLPTSWCKKHNITSSSRLSLEEESEGSLLLKHQEKEKKPKHIKLSTDESGVDLIQKLIVACYVNPATSFEINLEKGMDFTKLLDQKRIISLESVELDKNKIKSESAITVNDPASLLKTMLRKIKNMLSVMTKSYNLELIKRWEEEIDKNKLLIDKSIIGALTGNIQTKQKTIDLYYISILSKDLERMVDHLINIDKKEVKVLNEIYETIEFLKNIVENLDNKKSSHYLSYQNAIRFIKKADNIKVKDNNRYDELRVKTLLSNISEAMIDWAITKETES